MPYFSSAGGFGTCIRSLSQAGGCLLAFSFRKRFIMSEGSRGGRLIAALVGFLALVGLDLYTKHLAEAALSGGKVIEIIPGVFELYFLRNSGAAFGIFQNQKWLFTVIAVVMILAMTWVYIRIPAGKKYRPLGILLVFISAGAAGNLVDRLIYGSVRDFLYFCLINFPIFNVADIYVTCSVFVFFFLLLFRYKEEDAALLEQRIFSIK